MTGSEPNGSGPVSRARLEQARRRLYAPAAAPGAVEEYRRLAAVSVEPDLEPVGPGPAPAASGARHGGLARLLLIAVVGTAVVGVLAFPPPQPETVPLPGDAGGTTLVAYSRSHVDGTGPGIISYQPEGYSVFRSEGRALRVDLTCAGEGTVLISAGSRFRFTCGRATASFTQVDRRIVRDPFVVMGTTTGDVVWSVRISAVPAA